MGTNRWAVILFLMLLFPSCKREEQKAEFIARVNNSVLTPEEFYTMYDSSSGTKSDSIEIINNWIKKELFWQAAKRKGLLDTDQSRRIIRDAEKQLASSLLINEEIAQSRPDIIEDDLRYFYNNNKAFYLLKENSFLLNIIYFRDEQTAIKWRTEWINRNWDYVKKNVMKVSGIRISESVLLYPHEFSGKEMLSIVTGMKIGEVSLVIKINDTKFAVFGLVNLFPEGTLVPLEYIRDVVTNDYMSSLRKVKEKELLEKLTSESKIEIR